LFNVAAVCETRTTFWLVLMLLLVINVTYQSGVQPYVTRL